MILINFFKILIKALFKPEIKGDLNIAFYSLLNSSFRIPQKHQNSYYSYIVVLKQMIGKISINSKKENFSDYCFFDNSPTSESLRVEYLTNFYGNFEYQGIYRSELNINLFWALFSIFFIPFTIFISVFSKKNIASFALMHIEFCEIEIILKILSKKRIKKLFLFCIYEKDINFLALLIKNTEVHLIKIPSEVPLVFANRLLISDVLVICFKYQEEEMKYFSSTIKVGSHLFWGPERFTETVKNIKNPQVITNQVVAFYSSGNWLRELKGNLDLNIDEKKNEETLLANLITIIKKNGLKLLIYLHPSERNYNSDIVSDYYSKWLELDNNIQVVSDNYPTSYFFKFDNLAVALYSTLLFERIYFGYKTLIVPLGYEDWDFPIPGSPLNNICINELNKLEKKVLESINMTNQNFFAKNNIENYKMVV